ncbi:MAG: flagellin [Phycisphaerales bacterium]|nr:flagellin [Phycisphaerales bacterium]
MARINTNVPSVIAQSKLGRTQAQMQVHLERLSTGLKINRGKDDPAGLIISERIRSDLEGINQGIQNSSRASAMISTTEGALAEINDLLNSIRSLIVQSASTGSSSEAERQANQLQIDSAIESITRISNTATFGGLKLLNGSLDYQLSGVSRADIAKVRVNNASFINNTAVQVDVDVVGSAQTGALFYNGATTPPGVTLSALTLEITGPTGVQVITIPSGRPLSQLVQGVNNVSSMTGVQASLINNDANSGIVFESVDYGTKSFVSVKRLAPPAPAADSWGLYAFNGSAPRTADAPFGWTTLITAGTLVPGDRDKGQDVQALINGNLATGDGLNVKVSSASLGLDLTLTPTTATTPSGASTSFYITSGGALFQLGHEVTALQQATFGIQSVAASQLGGTNTGSTIEFLSTLKAGQSNSVAASVARSNFKPSSDILATAIDEITVLRGRLGAFERNVLDTNTRSLQSQFENLTASNSVIRDADFAAETSQLTRAQILASAGTSTLTLANQQAQQVLQLLG